MLSNWERETIICFNEDDKEADIFTYSKTWQQHLEQKLKLKPYMENGKGGKSYKIDKKRIRPPRAPKNLSKAQRKAIGERLQRTRV